MPPSRYDSIVKRPDGCWMAACDCGWHSHTSPTYGVVQVETKHHRIGCPYRHRARRPVAPGGRRRVWPRPAG